MNNPPSTASGRDDSLELDPIVDEVQSYLNLTTHPDPGDAFFQSITDNILKEIETPSQQKQHTMVSQHAEPSLLKRLTAFLRGPRLAWSAAALLLIVGGLIWGSQTPPLETPTTHGSEKMYTNLTKVPDTIEEGTSETWREDLEEMQPDQLREISVALEQLPTLDISIFEEEEDTWSDTLDTLDATELAMLDQSLQDSLFDEPPY